MPNDYFCLECALEQGELIKLDANDDSIPIKCPVCKGEESYYPREEFFQRLNKYRDNLGGVAVLAFLKKEKYYWEKW